MCFQASALIVDAETDEPDPLPDPEPEPEPELDPLPDPEPEPDPLLDPVLLDPELPLVSVATDTPVPLSEVVVFPIPFPASLSSFADILDKSENIGLSLLVILYAPTAAATHKTIIMEMIMFALSNFFPPINLILRYNILI